MDIDNSHCNLDVKRINTNLAQDIILRSNQGREFKIIKTMVNQQIDGIPARSHAKDENRKNMMIVLMNETNGNDDRVLKPSTNGTYEKS